MYVHVLAPVDIHGCILFCTINDLFRVIIVASLVISLCVQSAVILIHRSHLGNFTVCTICCNLDSQITPTTEDLQASRN